MPRRHLPARLVAVAALTSLVAAGLGGTATARSAGDCGLISTPRGTTYVSPNGDGHRDQALVRFRLGHAATVRAVVRRDGKRVSGPVDLGRLAAGRHSWQWTGRSHRRAVADGNYRVVLTAVTDRRSATATRYVIVDTARPEGELVTSRPTVHPLATEVEDRARLTWVVEGWNPFEEEMFPEEDRPAWARFEISDANGDVVWRTGVRRVYTPTFDWSAEQSGGAALPEGDYTARVTVADLAGNRRQATWMLTVSHDQLVEETWSATLPAGEASTYVPYYGSCNGCGEFCSPVPSERFAGGLSFRECPVQQGFGTAQSYAADVPFVEAPVDSYRITVDGGPTDGEETSTTTSPWQTPDLTGHPYLPDQDRQVTWSFGIDRDEASYDVDTFTVEYRHYVPAD